MLPARLLLFIAVVGYAPYVSAFWSKKEPVPLYCPVQHKVLESTMTMYGTQYHLVPGSTTLALYVPRYTTTTTTVEVKSVVQRTITATQKTALVTRTLLTSTTYLSRQHVVSSVTTTVYDTIVLYTTPTLTNYPYTVTSAIPATTSFKVFSTRTVSITRPETLFITETSTWEEYILPPVTKTATVVNTVCPL